MNAYNNGDTHVCYYRNRPVQTLFGFNGGYMPALTTDSLDVVTIYQSGTDVVVRWRMTPSVNVITFFSY